MPEPLKWLALRYSVPAEPSRSRVYVWRHLRALGAQSTAPGLAVLPDTHENLEAFESLAGDVRRFGGEALLIRFDFVEPQDEQALRNRFESAAAEEERLLLHRLAALSDRLGDHPDDAQTAAAIRESRQSLARFEKSPLRIFSKTPQGELRAAANEIRDTLRRLPNEVASLLRTFR